MEANAASVLIAGLAGALIGILTVFAKPFGLEMLMVSKLWPLILSFLVTYGLGYGLGFLVGYNQQERLEWTWKKIMAR